MSEFADNKKHLAAEHDKKVLIFVCASSSEDRLYNFKFEIVYRYQFAKQTMAINNEFDTRSSRQQTVLEFMKLQAMTHRVTV